MIKSKYVALQNTYNPWWLPTGVLSSTCVGAFLSKGASDFSHSLINLTGSTVVVLSVPQLMPGFSQDDGWIFDTPVTKRISILGVPQTATIFLKFTDCGLTLPNGIDTAILFAQDRYEVRPNTGSGVVWSCNAFLESPVLPDMTNGVIALKRTKGYRNGVLDCTLSRDKYMNIEFTIGRTQSKIHALAIYNVSLTDAQILSVSNAMNAL